MFLESEQNTEQGLTVQSPLHPWDNAWFLAAWVQSLPSATPAHTIALAAALLAPGRGMSRGVKAEFPCPAMGPAPPNSKESPSNGVYTQTHTSAKAQSASENGCCLGRENLSAVSGLQKCSWCSSSRQKYSWCSSSRSMACAHLEDSQ